MRKFVLIGLIVLSATNVFAEALALETPSYAPYSVADVVGGSCAIAPALAVVGTCGILMLPADVLLKIQYPEAAFSAHAGTPICSTTGTAIATALYVITGAPFGAAQHIVGVPQPPPSRSEQGATYHPI